ncbi:hypothetical protein LTS18_013175, partial [Coniosporium uncinatum]
MSGPGDTAIVAPAHRRSTPPSQSQQHQQGCSTMSASPEDDMSAAALAHAANANDVVADGGHATTSPATTASTTPTTTTTTGAAGAPAAAGTGTGTAVFEPAKPSTFLHVHRPRELEVQPMSTPRAREQRPLGPLDREQVEGLRAIRAFLKVRTSYDVLPLSFRLIIFDTALLVKKSLNILIQNGIVSAPLWDSKTSTFAGLLTTSDYINVIQYYWQNPD